MQTMQKTLKLIIIMLKSWEYYTAFLLIQVVYIFNIYPSCILKGECSVFFEKKYIMVENDSLSEYIKIALGHNHTKGAVYSKINVKVEICSALIVVIR